MEYDIVTYQFPVQMIRVSGRIDAQTAPALKDHLKAMTREGNSYFIVDLHDVTFIDSAGLGVLTSLLRASRAAGGDLRLVVRKGSAVFDILSVVRFDVVFSFYETPEAALYKFPS